MSRAGTSVQKYQVEPLYPDGSPAGAPGMANLYWAHDRVLIGGAMTNELVGMIGPLGVTHVLSAECERDDAGKWPDDRRFRIPFVDGGQALIPGPDLHGAMRFARTVLADPGNVLYAHCQFGGSRGPTMAYLAMRAGLGMTPEEAMRAIRATRGDWMPHAAYIGSVEIALSTWER